MPIDAQAYLNAAYPPPLRKPGETPRCFVLRWNNSKLKTRRKDDSWHEAHGVVFPNGRIALDYGCGYDMLSEMEAAYEAMGEHKIEWASEQGT